jgi:3-oxoacyl-[acyl-carrier protein] reductase
MEKQKRLDGQVALVTGRSRSIGAGIVRRLTPEGAAVALHRSKNTGSLDSSAEVHGIRITRVVPGLHELEAGERLFLLERSSCVR